MSDRAEVFIFWDSSARPRPNASGYDLVRAIRAFAGRLGVIKSLRFYVDISTTANRISPALASELQCSGVSIIDTVSNGRKGASSKMLIADCFLHLADTHSSIPVVVTGDPDISYAVSSLRLRGHQIVVVCPPNAHPNLASLAAGKGKSRADAYLDDVVRLLDVAIDEDVSADATVTQAPCVCALSASRPWKSPQASPHETPMSTQKPADDLQEHAPESLAASMSPRSPLPQQGPVSVPSPFPTPYREDDETSNAVSAADFPSSPETDLSQFSEVPRGSFSSAPTSTYPFLSKDGAVVDPDYGQDHALSWESMLSYEASSRLPVPPTPKLPPAPQPISQAASMQTVVGEVPTLGAITSMPPQPAPPSTSSQSSGLASSSLPSTSKMTPFAPAFVPSTSIPTTSTETKGSPQVIPKFRILVECLRSRAPTYTLLRGEVDPVLRMSDPDYLIKSGMGGTLRPVVTLLEDAFNAGIITSNTGDVVLNPIYRAPYIPRLPPQPAVRVLSHLQHVPQKFRVLVECLRSSRDFSMPRGSVDSQLNAIDNAYLAKAGLLHVKKPVNKYLDEAFEAGLITSGSSAKVVLVTAYRV